MYETTNPTPIQGQGQSAVNGTPNSFENTMGTFSNKNTIIIVLLVLLILSFIGINLLTLSGNILSNISEPLGPFIRSLLSMIGFTTGTIIKGSADLVANTADAGIDIAKGTTHSIGDLLINANQPGIDSSKQISLSDVIGGPNINAVSSSTSPQPVQSSNPTVVPISAQKAKAKAGWCYVGDDSAGRGCVEMSEHNKCMSGQIFVNQSDCLKPPK